MGHKAAETTCNINNAFGPEAANECPAAILVTEGGSLCTHKGGLQTCAG